MQQGAPEARVPKIRVAASFALTRYGTQVRGFAVFLVPPFGVTGSNPPLRRFNFSKRVAERGGFEPPIQLLGRITI